VRNRDEHACPEKGYAPLFGVPHDFFAAFEREFAFERSGDFVKTGVNNPAVPCGRFFTCGIVRLDRDDG
jgi:hypothetical protein